MHIEYLSLINFRNYARLDVSLPEKPIVLHGGNAQGKTSLLEAIYYVATSKSPYTTSDRQLIHWRAENEPIPYARISAEITSKQQPLNLLEIALVMDASSGISRYTKNIKLNGVKKRVMDVVGLLNVVLFLPQDLILIEGSPANRRRFLDDTLSQVNRKYLQSLDLYERILPQRNALLRRIALNQASVDELVYWDEQLIEAGSIIVAERQRFLRELEVEAQKAHHDLTGKKETLTIQYQPNFIPTAKSDGQLSFEVFGLDLHRDLSAESVAPQFADRLKEEQQDSIERGVTISGPHRDEIRFFINNRDCGLYGSRGQARTTVMALKLAEMIWMREQIGESPILLLDEVVAELDRSRREYLLERITDQTQTLVTTAELEVFPQAFLNRALVWQVANGQIETT